MKSKLFIFTILLITVFVNCDKDEQPIVVEDSDGIGTITLYVTKDYGGGYIQVFINGVSYGTISSYTTDRPACSMGTAVNANLDFGEYELLATDNAGNKWEYFLNLKSNCVLKEIKF